MHAQRRARILRDHPEVSKLQGPDRRTAWMCIGLVAAQSAMALWAPSLDGASYAIAVYGVGATLAQALFLAVHELAHDLAFREAWRNRALSLVTNLPLVAPFAIAFRAYHLDHHAHLGCRGRDADVPTEWEARHVRGRGAKLLWLSLQIFAYALRPLLTYRIPMTSWLCANVACQVAFVTAVVAVVGPSPLVYLALSIVVAGGAHPCAGHFLSEHLYSCPTQETFSYYGPWNRLAWNVGYHNEHHDFPRVAWSRLPRLHELARDHYDELAKCESWPMLLVAFVLDDRLTLDAPRSE